MFRRVGLVQSLTQEFLSLDQLNLKVGHAGRKLLELIILALEIDCEIVVLKIESRVEKFRLDKSLLNSVVVTTQFLQLLTDVLVLLPQILVVSFHFIDFALQLDITSRDMLLHRHGVFKLVVPLNFAGALHKLLLSLMLLQEGFEVSDLLLQDIVFSAESSHLSAHLCRALVLPRRRVLCRSVLAFRLQLAVFFFQDGYRLVILVLLSNECFF
jgi:hypothetical protein